MFRFWRITAQDLGWERDNLLAALSIGFRVLAGLVQALGLLRWVMLVPSLAAAYVAPGATAGLFDAMNHYLGAGVGEHLGYLFTGASTVMVSALIWTQWRPLAVAGALIALGSVAGMAEPFGVPMTSMINALSFSLWALGRSYSASWCAARRAPRRAGNGAACLS